MPICIYSEFQLGDIIVRYLRSGSNLDTIGLVLVPATCANDVVTPRECLDASYIRNLPSQWQPVQAWNVDSLVHVHVRGDPLTGGFGQGRTMRDGKSTSDLRFRSQVVKRHGKTTFIQTELADDRGLILIHELANTECDRMLRIRTSARNTGDTPLTLELLTSFSLGGISPFCEDDSSGKIWIHRFRSAWSAEGRPDTQSAEQLHLERSWSGHGIRAERFGAVGSLPVNGWFPVVAVEDRSADVTWGARLAQPGSWQLELFRRADQLAISGGLPDREFGHWWKTLALNEEFVAPEAWVSVADGPPEKIWDRLQDGFRSNRDQLPPGECDLPIIFNEWCTSWGNPTHQNLIKLADRLRGTGVRYLVIDDGWAERPDGQPQQNGDWMVSRTAFPDGLRSTTDAIRERGLIPGLWFEFEVCNRGSQAWNKTTHQLQRDGHVIQVGNRRFWDFRDPWVQDYLAEKVIRLLQDNNFGYLKVDYNETIGLGCDGAESPGEGLRQHLAGVQVFFAKLRAELPGLVIESCSSGGHRLEPSFICSSAMSSFSDAHETPNIPIIAANLLPLIPSRQCQIWAVLRKSDTSKRLNYSLASTFLGRMCLSGEIHELSAAQWAHVNEAIELYRQVASVIRKGLAVRYGALGSSYESPQGWQAVVRTSPDGAICLIVIHTFEAINSSEVVMPLPPGKWQIFRSLVGNIGKYEILGNRLVCQKLEEFSGAVLILKP